MFNNSIKGGHMRNVSGADTTGVMKKVIMLVCLFSLVLFIGSVSARCVGPVVNGRCLGTEVYGSDDQQGSYRGSSGAYYQYDLNKPADRNRYGYDYDAQRRDQRNSLYPARILDGYTGGGIRK